MGKQTFVWPKGFLWGAATAAHQIEGATNNNWTEWELKTAAERAKTAEDRWGHLPNWEAIRSEATNPENYVSGKSTDHYRRYREDFDLLQQLGLNTFRFSIEWSRIEPEEGKWNSEAIDHYREYIRELRRRNIEPVMTLFHWTVPKWFAAKGGFEKRRNIAYFERFAEKIIHQYADDVKYIVTINEPDSVFSCTYLLGEHPPGKKSVWKGIQAYHNLLVAHKKVYKMAKKLNNNFIVGFSKTCAYVVPGDEHWLTKIAVKLDYFVRDDMILAYTKGTLDFLGVQYYFTDTYYGTKLRNHDEPEELTDMGWGRHPENLEKVLLRLGKKNIPLMVTETGLADTNDRWREEWILRTVLAVKHALQAGVDMRGYLYWSLLDNFEWAYGRWPHFGLIAVDYDNGERRSIRQSAFVYAAIIKKALST